MITQEFCRFLAELENNNRKEWFDEQRKRYETHVKKPFAALVADMLPHMSTLDPQIDMQPKDAIFRINRDIRFSADKSPYNTTMKAAFVRGGRKSANAGYFLGISAEQIHLGGGAYNPDKDGIQAIRRRIADKPQAFGRICRDAAFVDLFGEVQGAAVKRVPADLRDAFETEPLVANKQWYVMRAEPIAPLLKAGTLETRIAELTAAAAPLISYLNEAIAAA